MMATERVLLALFCVVYVANVAVNCQVPSVGKCPTNLTPKNILSPMKVSVFKSENYLGLFFYYSNSFYSVNYNYSEKQIMRTEYLYGNYIKL